MIFQAENSTADTSIRCTKLEIDMDHPKHLHYFVEILIPDNGPLAVNIAGNDYVANEGDIVIINSFQTHSFPARKELTLYLILFTSDLCTNLFGSEFLPFSENYPIFTPSKELYDFVKTRILRHDSKIIKPGDEAFNPLKIAICAIFEEYSRKVPLCLQLQSQKSVLAKILTYVKTNYTNQITLETAAKELGYSVGYLSSCIKILSNMNFRKIVNSFRIDKAKKMLLSNKQTVDEIAAECGFSEERSFHRAFRSMMGVTPTEYRKNLASQKK